jgi:hypothetical protein
VTSAIIRIHKKCEEITAFDITSLARELIFHGIGYCYRKELRRKMVV